MRLLLHMILPLLRIPARWPLPTISILILVARPSIAVVVLSLLGLIVTWQATMFCARLASVTNLIRLREEFLSSELRLCRLSNDHPAVARTLAHPMISGWVRAKTWIVEGWKKRDRLTGDIGAVNVYVVHALITDGRVPPAFKSFPVFDGPSFVFVHMHPDEGVLARFLLSHEIGHLGWTASKRQLELSRFPQWIIVVIFTLLAGGASWEAGLVAVGATLCFVSPLIGIGLLQEELWADKVGLWGASASDGHPAAARRVLRFLENCSASAARFRAPPREQFCDSPDVLDPAASRWAQRLVRLLDLWLNARYALRRLQLNMLIGARIRQTREISERPEVGTGSTLHVDALVGSLAIGAAVVLWGLRLGDLKVVGPMVLLLACACLLAVLNHFALGFVLGTMDWANEYTHAIPECDDPQWRDLPRRSPYH